MPLIALVFLIGFIAEIVSIVIMTKLVGGLLTFVFMILGVMFGGFLLRNNGQVSKMILAGGFLKNGNVSFYELLLPVRIPVAGLLFLLPGFFSDALGLILLFPFKFKSTHSQNGAFEQTQFYQNHHSRHSNDDVIEGDFVVRNPPKPTADEDIIEHKK